MLFEVHRIAFHTSGRSRMEGSTFEVFKLQILKYFVFSWPKRTVFIVIQLKIAVIVGYCVYVLV